MKETIITAPILSRDLNGEYKLWNDNTDIHLVNGQWLGMDLPGYFNTAMVEKHLNITFPNMSLSIAPGFKVEIEVVKVIQTSVKHIGDATK